MMVVLGGAVDWEGEGRCGKGFMRCRLPDDRAMKGLAVFFWWVLVFL